MNKGSQLNKELGVPNEHGVTAEQRARGFKRTRSQGSQLNKEAGV